MAIDRHTGADGRGGEQRHRDGRAHQQAAPCRHGAHRGAGGRQQRTPATDPDDDGHTILGMVPLCFGRTQIGGDGPPYYPMARAIAGGLVFSTVVSLLFLPTIYTMLDDANLNMRRIIRTARERAPLAPKITPRPKCRPTRQAQRAAAGAVGQAWRGACEKSRIPRPRANRRAGERLVWTKIIRSRSLFPALSSASKGPGTRAPSRSGPCRSGQSEAPSPTVTPIAAVIQMPAAVVSPGSPGCAQLEDGAGAMKPMPVATPGITRDIPSEFMPLASAESTKGFPSDQDVRSQPAPCRLARVGNPRWLRARIAAISRTTTRADCAESGSPEVSSPQKRSIMTCLSLRR